MKEIWINLELYFEIYEISNFRDFSRFFSEFIFDCLVLKLIKKGATWMQRGTQGHMVEPRGLTRALVWRGCDTWAYIHIIYIILKVKVHVSILYSELTNLINCHTLYTRHSSSISTM